MELCVCVCACVCGFSRVRVCVHVCCVYDKVTTGRKKEQVRMECLYVVMFVPKCVCVCEVK